MPRWANTGAAAIPRKVLQNTMSLTQERSKLDRAAADEAMLNLWRHLFGDATGYLGLFSGERIAGSKKLLNERSAFYAYPVTAGNAAQWLQDEARAGRETYFTVHLLTDRRRVKEHAAQVLTLWADGDTATVPPDLPSPTAVVESSPGRWHYYWRLTRPLPPQQAEELNRRMTYAVGADSGGWHLGKLLRPPALPNHKHPGNPLVRLVDLRDEAYDPDQLDVLLPSAGPMPTQPATEPTDGWDVPPVRLSSDALALWQGKRSVTGDAGAVDRSRTLWAIGRELAKAGATQPTIAAALANRDQALGYGKYSDRPDGGATEYHRIAAKVIADLETTVPLVIATPQAATGDELADIMRELAAFRAEVQALRDENRRLRARQSAVAQVLRNPHLKGEKLTALAALFAYESAESRGDITDDGHAPVSRAQLAKASGQSEQAVSTHLKRLEKWQVFSRRVTRTTSTRVDTETGEILEGYVSQLEIRPLASPDETLERLAELAPVDKPKWGGRRVACPDHPHADVIIRRTAVCADCGTILEQTEEQQSPADAETEPLKSNLETSDPAPETPPLWERTLGIQNAISAPADDAGSRKSILTLQASSNGQAPVAQSFCRGCDGLLPTAAARAAGLCRACQDERRPRSTLLLLERDCFSSSQSSQSSRPGEKPHAEGVAV